MIDLCAWCGYPIEKGFGDFCSEDCADEAEANGYYDGPEWPDEWW